MFWCAGQASACTSNNGNILRQEGFGGASWDYQYDEYNRLKWAEEKVAGASKWHQQFLFDAFGNRRLLNDAGTLIPNQMMTPRVGLVTDPNPFNTANNQWTGAEYYPNGNQKTAWGNGTDVGSAKYFYDGENRMRQADVNWPGSGTITTMEYGYDGEGRRVLRKVGGAVRTVWVYDAMGQMVAEYESGTVAAPSCGGPCYLTADHLGSTRVVWGGDGAIKQLRDYAPFGEEVVSTFRGDDARYPTALYPRSGTQSLPVEFTGKERDAETGLDYFGARYLNSALGRWTSPDAPLIGQHESDPQSWNLYTYVRNNPLRYRDPNGRDYHVCLNSGSGQSCFDLSDSQYEKLRKQQHGKQGIGMPIGTGYIYCGGKPCGYTQYSEQSMEDETPSIAIGFTGGKITEVALSKVSGWFARWLGRRAATAAAKATSGVVSGKLFTGFAEAEVVMIQKSLTALEAAGYNTGKIREIIKVTDAPPSYIAGALSNMGGEADTILLSPGAFRSQQFLTHAIEEEVVHLGQNVQKIGVGDAVKLERAVDAVRKFPEH